MIGKKILVYGNGVVILNKQWGNVPHCKVVIN